MSKKYIRTLSVLFCLVGILSVLALPSLTKDSLHRSLDRCVTLLIPSLFPMMVLSRRLLSGLSLKDSRRYRRLSKITGIPVSLLPVFAVGLFCGYPVPAILIARQYEQRLITRKEAEFGVALCNNASPGFLIAFAGGSILQSVKAGVFLYLSQILAVICTAHLIKPPSSTGFPPMPAQDAGLVADIRQSVYTLLELFGFVAFFSLAGDFFGTLLVQLSAPPVPAAFLSGLVEITGSITALSCAPLFWRRLLLPVLSALGGVSVFFQIASVLPKTLSMKPYLKARCLIAPLMTACFLIMTYLSK